MTTVKFSQPTLKLPKASCSENNPLPYCVSEIQLRFLLLAAKRILTDEIVKSSLGTKSTRKGSLYFYNKSYYKELPPSRDGSNTSQDSGFL